MQLSRIRDAIANFKFLLGRGQQYISLLFWAITISNVVLANIKTYMTLTLNQYILMSVSGTLVIVLGVWLIGYVDVKYRLYGKEQEVAQLKQPVMKTILDKVNSMEKQLKNLSEPKVE